MRGIFMIELLAMFPPPADGQADASGQMMSTFIMFGAIIAIFYFMIIRPQKKRQDEMKKMLDGLKKGDKVVLASGIHGTISEVEDNSALVQIADNVKIKVEKSAIGNIVPKEKKLEKGDKAE
jgi:preprotein translocase subunit YajC